MEYEKCYVFRPEHSRSAKKRRTEPQGLQASWGLRRNAYKRAWEEVQERIDSKLESVHAAIVQEVASFLDEAESSSVRSAIPTGLILTGPDSGLRASISQKSFARGANVTRRLFASLPSNAGTNLKNVLKVLIQRATIQNQLGDQGDDDDEDAQISSRNGRRLLGYDLQILQDYVDHHQVTQVVVAFEDTEAFDSDLLSSLIGMLGSWRDRIPFVCLFNIAISVDSLQQRLSQDAVKALDGRLFDAALSDKETEQVFEAITAPETKIWIGPGLMTAMLERQTDFMASVDSFVHCLQYTYMSGYYANALSIFLDPGTGFEEIPPDHFEAARSLESFQTFAKTVLEARDVTRLQGLLESDKLLYEFIMESVARGRIAMTNIMSATSLVRCIQDHLPNTNTSSQSALYSQAITGKLPGSPLVRSLLLAVKTTSSDIALKIIQEVSSSDISPDICDASREIAEELTSLIQTAAGTSKPLRSEDSVGNSTVRTTVVAQKVELSKQKSSLSKSDATYTRIVRRFCDLVTAHLTHNTTPPSELIFNEIFFYDLKSPYREVFLPRPRHAIERALATPHDYLDCECCANTANENDETTMAATQPATALLYQLCLESGNLINAHDLWQAYQTLTDDTTENEKSTMASFQRALAELRYLGIVKSTRKRADHVAKVAWRGL